MFSDFLYETITKNHESNDKNLPVWCIGDVHGCTIQYEKILEQIAEKDPDCIIYQLGDLIDRGPGLETVFRLSKRFGVRLLLGNHELNFLQEHFGYKQCRSIARKKNHDRLGLMSQDVQSFIVDCMLGMINYATVEQGGKTWTLSHAPIIKDFTVIEDCGAASVYCMGTTPYSNESRYDNSVHGHMHWNYWDIQKQIDDPNKKTYNVDGGCCYGGELVAIELGSKEVIRVPGSNWAEH